MEGGVSVPRAYLLPRGASSGIVQSAVLALSITPICCVIISRSEDSPTAHEFSGMVVRTDTDTDAIQFALSVFEKTNMPCLIVGEVSAIMAVHEDGRLEEMKWPVPDLTIN